MYTCRSMAHMCWTAQSTHRPVFNRFQPQTTVYTVKRFFHPGKIKRSFNWPSRVSQELMGSCVAATWTRRCRLHSCTEPMVTTRLPSARCTPPPLPTPQSHGQWNSTAATILHFLCVSFSRTEHVNTCLPLFIASTGHP